MLRILKKKWKRLNQAEKIIRSHHRAILFIVIGAFIAVLDTFMIWFFVNMLFLNLSIAVSVAYFIAILIHFTLNNWLTFRESNVELAQKILGYLVVTFVNYLITLGVIYFTIYFIINQIVIAKILAIMVTFLTGFLGMRFLVSKVK